MIQQLEQLYREMAPALLAYFRRQHGLAESADDMLQDTFVRALRGSAHLGAAVSPRAYVFGIARHLSLDALRRRSLDETVLPEALAADMQRPDDRLEMMRMAIDALPPSQREPLLLKLHHDMSYHEIAEILHVPVGTVRSRLHHAVRRLKENLNPGTTVPAKANPLPHE